MSRADPRLTAAAPLKQETGEPTAKLNNSALPVLSDVTLWVTKAPNVGRNWNIIF